ncbi:MAG: hypothetical protein WCH04_20045 [Gammaproteobacteria bacterium]
MNEIVPRYEFRIFGTCLGMAEQRLRALAPCESISESREIYLLDGDRVHEMNVKIRRGKLELKRLVDRHRGLERWRPDGQWAFPVAPDTLRDTLWPDALPDLVTARSTMLSGNDLLRLVAHRDVSLQRANVAKRRFRFSLPACRAELDQLLVNGAAIESLAVESEDPQALLGLQSTLRLEDCENQCYPLALSRILGITPLPREEDYG